MLRVALYGSSLAVGSIGEVLREVPGLHVTRIEPDSPDNGSPPRDADIILFDMAAGLPPAILSLWQEDVQLVVIGLDVLSQRASVLTSERVEVRTKEDLVALIEGRARRSD